jgi:hypothetical protein
MGVLGFGMNAALLLFGDRFFICDNFNEVSFPSSTWKLTSSAALSGPGLLPLISVEDKPTSTSSSPRPAVSVIVFFLE